jgi:hypothetical protein
MFIDWLLEPVGEKINFKKAIVWIAPPITYLGFCMVRGYLTGWYPYSFLDPNKTFLGDMLTYLITVLVGMFVLTFVLTKIVRVAK